MTEAAAPEEVTIIAVDRTALAKLKSEWTEMLAAYKDVPCDSLEAKAQWVEWRNHVHDIITGNETDRTDLTRPINAELRTLNTWFKESVAPAVAFKELANAKVEAFELAQDAAAKAAREAAQLAAQTGDDEAVYEALAAIPEQEKVEGNSTRFSWEPTVVDFAKLDDSYKLADLKKLKLFAGIHGKSDVAPVLPGVTFTRKAKSQPTGSRK